MKKILIILSIIFLCACEKCDYISTENPTPESKDEYYIRYTCRTGGNAYSTVTMRYIEANGQWVTKTGKYTTGVTQTIGPVKKGFTAKMSSDVKTNTIECCKNNGPFMLKSENGSYTIDF